MNPLESACNFMVSVFGYTPTEAGKRFLQLSIDHDASPLCAAAGMAVAVIAFALNDGADHSARMACIKNMDALNGGGLPEPRMYDIFVHNLERFAHENNVASFVEAFSSNVGSDPLVEQ